MGIKSTILTKLLLDTRDGDWGQETTSPGFKPYKVIRGADFPAVRQGDLSKVPIRYISENSSERRTLQPNDIIIETAGGSNDRATGRTILVTERLLANSSLPITCASFCRFLRVDPLLADPSYIYWYLQYLYEKGEMWQHQVQHTGIARFQYTRFAGAVSIPLPDNSQQQAIARILNSLDEKIELNYEMNETLNAIVRVLFRSWFVDFDPVRAMMEGRVPIGISGEIATLFPDSFDESALGATPKGWKIGILADIADNPRRGVAPNDVSQDTPYVGLEHIPRKSIALGEWGLAQDVTSNKYHFYQGEILFGKLRPYFHKVGVAVQDGVCSTDILVIAPRTQEWFSFVLGLVSSDEFVQYADGTSTGTKMPRTNWNDMKAYKIVLPPKEIVEAFNKIVTSMVEAIRANIWQSHTLTTIRDTLLPKLLSGDLLVKDAEKYAATLL